MFSYTNFRAGNFLTTVSHIEPNSSRKVIETCPCVFSQTVVCALCNVRLPFQKTATVSLLPTNDKREAKETFP